MQVQLTKISFAEFKALCDRSGSIHYLRQNCHAKDFALLLFVFMGAGFTVATLGAVQLIPQGVWKLSAGGLFSIVALAVFLPLVISLIAYSKLKDRYFDEDEHVIFTTDGIGIWSKGRSAFFPWSAFSEFQCYRPDSQEYPDDYDLELYYRGAAPEPVLGAFIYAKEKYLRSYGKNLDRLISKNFWMLGSRIITNNLSA